MDSGLSGAITSIAPSPTVMASTALDRFVRIHCTPLPPQQAGQQVEKKGEILDKVYVKSIPTVIIWDGDIARDLNVKNLKKRKVTVKTGMFGMVWRMWMIATETRLEAEQDRNVTRKVGPDRHLSAVHYMYTPQIQNSPSIIKRFTRIQYWEDKTVLHNLHHNVCHMRQRCR